MKRLGNVYDKIISVDNLLLAHKNACKGKSKQKGVITFKRNLQRNISLLNEELVLCNYKSPEYKVFKIHEPKEREIFVMPYRDRIIQHAILQITGSMFRRNLTVNTYSCIVGRGIHLAKNNVTKYLKDKTGTKYCLKFDIKKFYPSVDHEILKVLITKNIKDERLLKLLFEIIDGVEVGIPIGNFLSQVFGNLYLSYFDHWLKEELKLKYVARYCDDIVILSDNKEHLHETLFKCRNYLKDNLKLEIKSNYQIFPVASRGIDFLGYKMFHSHTLIRNSIKKNYLIMLKHNPNKQSISSYDGWLKWCNSINLKNKHKT